MNCDLTNKNLKFEQTFHVLVNMFSFVFWIKLSWKFEIWNRVSEFEHFDVVFWKKIYILVQIKKKCCCVHPCICWRTDQCNFVHLLVKKDRPRMPHIVDNIWTATWQRCPSCPWIRRQLYQLEIFAETRQRSLCTNYLFSNSCTCILHLVITNLKKCWVRTSVFSCCTNYSHFVKHRYQTENVNSICCAADNNEKVAT